MSGAKQQLVHAGWPAGEVVWAELTACWCLLPCLFTLPLLLNRLPQSSP